MLISATSQMQYGTICHTRNVNIKPHQYYHQLKKRAARTLHVTNTVLGFISTKDPGSSSVHYILG